MITSIIHTLIVEEIKSGLLWPAFWPCESLASHRSPLQGVANVPSLIKFSKEWSGIEFFLVFRKLVLYVACLHTWTVAEEGQPRQCQFGSVLIFEALTPLQKSLNLGERPSPLFQLSLKVSSVWCVFAVGVSGPRRVLKQWRIAAEYSKHKKMQIPQKLTYLPAK